MTALAITPKFAPGTPTIVRAYVQAVAAWANADHESTVMRATLADDLGVSERTVQRAHAAAEGRGLVRRVAGGHRGRTQTVVLTCLRGLQQQQRRALDAIRRAQRIRRERAAARVRGLGRKGDTGVSPHNPYGEGRAPRPPALPFHGHPFDPDGDGTCRTCCLPRGNRTHIG